MNEKEKTGQEVRLSIDSETLSRLLPEKNQDAFLRELFLKQLGKDFYVKDVVHFLEVVKKAFCFNGILFKSPGSFALFVMDLYFDIAESGLFYHEACKWMLEEISHGLLYETRDEVFDFFCVVHSPKKYTFLCDTSTKWREKSRFFEIQNERFEKEIKDKIEALLAERLLLKEDSKFIFELMQFSSVPDEILERLAHTRIKTGGAYIIRIDAERIKFLEEFNYDYRSQAGKELAVRKLREIKEWDEAVNKLRDSLEKERASIDEFVEGIVEKETLEKGAIKSIQIAYDKKPDPRLLLGNEKRDILITLLIEPGIKSSSFFANMRDEMQKVISEWITDNLRKHAGRDLITSVLVLECEGQIVAWDRVG